MMTFEQPAARVSYDFDIDLSSLLDGFLSQRVPPPSGGQERRGNQPRKK